jgi:hypothetical protein
MQVEVGLGEGSWVPAEIGEDGLGRAHVVLDDERLLDVDEFPYTDKAWCDGSMALLAATDDLEGWWRWRRERTQNGQIRVY